MFTCLSAVLRFLSFLFILLSAKGVPQLLRDDCHNKTIFDIVVSENLSPTANFDKNGSNFNILANLLAAGNNEGLLNTSNAGGITLFAPNDDAIVRTAQDLGYRGNDEYECYEYLISNLSRRYENPIEYLFNMPLYHIVAPSMNSTMVLEKTSFGTWDSGLPLHRIGLRLVDGNLELPDAELVPEMLDICTSNGYIHVINRVLFAKPLAQPEERLKRQDEDIPCLEHSEEPLYSPEYDDLKTIDGLVAPTMHTESHEEYGEHPKVGPIDINKPTLNPVSVPSHLPLPSWDFEYLGTPSETQSSEVNDSPEPTPHFIPSWNLNEPVILSPFPYETFDYNVDSSPSLDDNVSARPFPTLLEEYVPDSEFLTQTVQPSLLPVLPTDVSSNLKSTDPSEPDPTHLDLFSTGPSPYFEELSPSTLPNFNFDIDPAAPSRESTAIIEGHFVESSTIPEESFSSLLEGSPQETFDIEGTLDIFACFPRNAVVHLSHGKDIQVQDLQAGHRVMSCESQSSAVYMFTHRTPVGLYPFVRIESVNNHTVELSPEHYIYANERLVVAERVEVGDRLRTLDGPSKVAKISRVHRYGLYAPHTLHGDIVVGRIVVSTYTNALPYWIAHPILEVLRIPVRLGITKEPIGGLLYNGCPKWKNLRTWLF